MKNRSLKFKILFLTILVGFVGIAGLISNVYNEWAALDKNSQEVARTASSTLLDKLDRNLFERYGDVQAYAASDPALSGDSKRINVFMNEMMGIYSPVYDLMIVTNLSGKVIAINTVNKAGAAMDTHSLLGRDFSSSEWFKRNVSGEIKAGTAYIEDLHIDGDAAKILGTDGSVMAFSAPIFAKNGKITGVWRNYVSWKDVVVTLIEEEVKKLQNDEVQHVFPYLIAANGMTLLDTFNKDHVLKKEFLSAKELATKEKIFDRKLHISSPTFTGEVREAMAASRGYSIYPGIGWRLAIQIPSSDPDVYFAMMLGILSLVVLCAIIVVAYFLVSRLSVKLLKINTNLIDSTNGTMNAASTISDAANALAAAVSEQAAAVQETAASMEEMNAMVRKSADNAEQARRTASTSQDAVSRGRTAVQSMISAMDEINTSNTDLASQVEESNRKLVEVTRVINEIAAKTKVINEIVFQTKLLSFNASVEAARAGEHGKGFAVVAEEVGNLAQMSGNAAKEISDLLDASTNRVNEIVSDTKTRVERAMQIGRGKVEAGANLARQCDAALDEVVRSVSDVGVMVSEISTATAETSTGLAEISRAINQIDQVTHQNSAASHTAAEEGKKIAARVQEMAEIASDLASLVSGSNRSKYAAPTLSAPTNAKKSQEDHSSIANVVNLHRNKDPQHPPRQAHPPVIKTTGGVAMGSDVVPSQDDPRFEEV